MALPPLDVVGIGIGAVDTIIQQYLAEAGLAGVLGGRRIEVQLSDTARGEAGTLKALGVTRSDPPRPPAGQEVLM